MDYNQKETRQPLILREDYGDLARAIQAEQNTPPPQQISIAEVVKFVAVIFTLYAIWAGLDFYQAFIDYRTALGQQ